MKQELSTQLSDQTLAELRQLTNQGGNKGVQVKRIVIDYRDEIEETKDGLKKNTNYGGFAIITGEETEDGYKRIYQPIGLVFKAVILKKRYLAKVFDAKANETIYHTKEFDSWLQPINLYDNQNQIIKNGLYKDLKQQFDLKPTMVLYIYYKDDIYRLILSSSAMGNFWKYEEQFNGTSFCLFNTQFSTTKERKTATSPIYFMGHFNVKEAVDANKSIELVKGLNEALNMYEAERDKNVKNELTNNDIVDVFNN